MKKKRRSKYKHKSIINNLISNNIINESNLTFIDSMSLEDLIAVKLELSARYINNKLYAFNLLSNTNRLVKEAIIKFAISATDSKMDAARFLGIDYEGLHRLVREYSLQEYFDEINN